MDVLHLNAAYLAPSQYYFNPTSVFIEFRRRLYKLPFNLKILSYSIHCKSNKKKKSNYPFIKISQVNPRLIQPTSFLWILCKINQKHNPLFSHNLFALLTHFLGQFTSFSFFEFVNAGLRLVTHLSTSPVSADLKQDKEEHHYTVNTKS